MEELTLRQARESKGFSLRGAAKLLNITHAYLSALELGHKPLHEERSREIAALYNLPAGTVLVQPLPQDKGEFTEWLRNQIKWWDSRFVLPMIPAVTRQITDLYVSPTLVTQAGTLQKHNDILELFFHDPENKALLLSGNIGTGKSFFLRMLTLEIDSLYEQLKLSNRFVPILVSLGEFQLSQGSLVQSLVNYYKDHGYEGSALELENFFKQCLQRGTGLFLLDGLDEIQDRTQRVTMLARLEQHFEDTIRKQGNKLIISGRPDAFFERDPNYNGFELVQIYYWQTQQMFESCERWSWENEDQGKRFWLTLQASDALFSLASWPLLFHLLTTLYSSVGLRSFQELSGLCDACCQVLENSWNSARRTFQKPLQSESQDDVLYGQAWLKWRHFLIHLMESVLESAINAGQNFQLAFSVVEMKQAWESFLTKRGVKRDSLLYARLEDLIFDQDRIGPVIYRRQIGKHEGKSGISKKFTFVDPLFGQYYLAKALNNRPEQLDSIIQNFMRRPDWEQVLCFTIQELGRSDRSYENKLGENLIEALLAYDDERQLEKKHQIGHFGLFLGMQSIATFNLDRYWDRIVEPFLNLYLTSFYERDVSKAFQILGEYSAARSIRKYFLDLYADVSDQKGLLPHDYKWRALAALAKVGERTESSVDEITKDIRSLLKDRKKQTFSDCISLRRIFWSLQQIGRVLMISENGISADGKEYQEASIKSLRKAILDSVKFYCQSFEQELHEHNYSALPPWDELLVVLRTQNHLHYSRDLKITVNSFVRVVTENFEVCFTEYPFRQQLIQFLKCALRYSYLLDRSLEKILVEKLADLYDRSDEVEKIEIDIVLKLARARDVTVEQKLAKGDWFSEIFGQPAVSKLETWITEVEKQVTAGSLSFIRLGQAITGIHEWSSMLEEEEYLPLRDRALNVLLRALSFELDLDARIREKERIFTVPFTDYGFPIYDHIYNCIAQLGRGFPLSKDN
jgi:transcriptional regulator with XRE-family HTH domain